MVELAIYHTGQRLTNYLTLASNRWFFPIILKSFWIVVHIVCHAPSLFTKLVIKKQKCDTGFVSQPTSWYNNRASNSTSHITTQPRFTWLLVFAEETHQIRSFVSYGSNLPNLFTSIARFVSLHLVGVYITL